MLNKSRYHTRRASVIKTIALSTAMTGAALLGLISNTHAADADPARGGQIAQTCYGCHGAPGLRNPGPVYKIPMVGGQYAEYIVAALKAYKDKTRPHETMRAQAASLTDQDMLDIAAHFAEIESNSRPSLASAALIAKGKEKAAACAACHGATGDGVSSAFPKLAGQYPSYLIQALKEYRSGARENAIMGGQAKSLTIRDIEAIAAYYGSQQGGLSAPQVESIK